MNMEEIISREIGCRLPQAQAAIRLLDEGNTVPFIARYRKEATGGLDDTQLRALSERLVYLRNLEKRKEEVIEAIDGLGKLTDELRTQILAAEKLVTVEDLYRPYKQKKKTRAELAKRRGLLPLADYITAQEAKEPLLVTAEQYVTGPVNPESESKEDAIKASEREVLTAEAALAGASDILAERISDSAEIRAFIRRLTKEEGTLLVRAKDAEAESVYQNYYDYEEAIRRIADHRVLAINRGEAEGYLTVSVNAPTERILGYLKKQLVTADNPYCTPALVAAGEDAYERLIAPSIEREIRAELREKAETGAMSVFGKNLEQLLLQPPIAGQTVLGWDPAFRTGCKLAVVDATGKVLATRVIYPTAPHNQVDEAKAVLKKLIADYRISLISIGNGTASRESEQIVVELLKEIPEAHVQYVITNEAGASVYSASSLGAEEFPELDVGGRSAVSIARRVQDPLAELVKIDPKSIGVGQYQHDMNQKRLTETLNGVVEASVNRVGVDLNTASAALLGHIAGITGATAKNIVAYRDKNGRFVSRAELLKVAKLGPKAYEQCAGFCRISGGEEPLDATSVHPESYGAARALLQKMDCDIRDEERIRAFERSIHDRAALAAEVGCGELTLFDILEELKKPARDPREDMPKPVLRSDVLEMKDLKPGMKLRGTVRNVIDFGAFVDIGVHQDGLVHISQIADRYIAHPLEALSVGDIVEVTVLSVDEAKGRISLTMRNDADEPKRASGSSAADQGLGGTGTRHIDESKDTAKKHQKEKIRNGGDSPKKRSAGGGKRTGSREDFAPGTIGYLLAHKK